MARPANKQGFRPITVDNIPYRWRCGSNRSADIEIQLETLSSARGQRLCVNLQCDLPLRVVSSRHVSSMIVSAIAKGWQPKDFAPDFTADLISISEDGRVVLDRRPQSFV